MRHWQPVHHARLRDFLAGVAAALRGEAVPAALKESRPPGGFSVAPVAFALPPVSEIPPQISPPPAAPPAPAPVAAPPPVVSEIPSPPPAPPAPASTDIRLPGGSPSVLPPPSSPVAVAPPPSTARAFFAALGWGTGAATRPAALPTPAPEVPASVPTPLPAPLPVAAGAAASPSASTSAAFFHSLPWTGAPALGEVITSIRVSAARADSALDPRTAALPSDNPLLTGMLSAARTSDRLAASTLPSPATAPSKARPFFASLPW